MQDFLTPAKTTLTKSQPSPAKTAPKANVSARVVVRPEDALEILRSEPTLDELGGILKYINGTPSSSVNFSIADPGPVSSQIVHALVNLTIPDYWESLHESRPHEKTGLIRILRTVSGLGALIARLKLLVLQLEQKLDNARLEATRKQIADVIVIIENVLDGESTSLSVWQAIKKAIKSDAKCLLTWKEYVLQVAGGKIISVVAEGEQHLKKSKDRHRASWVADGEQFASWLGKNIAVMISVTGEVETETWAAAAKLCGKALSLGYRGTFADFLSRITLISTGKTVTETIIGLYLPKRNDGINISKWTSKLQSHEQRVFLETILSSTLPTLMRSEINSAGNIPANSKIISAGASLVNALTANNPNPKGIVASWLSKGNSQAGDGSIAVIRAIVAALSIDDGTGWTLSREYPGKLS